MNPQERSERRERSERSEEATREKENEQTGHGVHISANPTAQQ
jgi:hypothetical protein